MKLTYKLLLVVFFSLFSFAVATPAHAVNSIIAHWKFDDGTGTAPVDSSGNNITASFTTPNPTWTSNVPSVSFTNPYSLNFTGNHDGVTVAWPSNLNFGATDPRTFSFWYKPVANGEPDGTQARILSWTSDNFEISGTDGSSSTHRIAYYDGNWHSTNINLSLGTWYHVTFTYDGTTAKFYIGGVLQDSHALAGRALSGTMGIGTRVQTLNEGINGNIDDVRIYNYALDATQVGNLTAGSNNPDSPPDSTPPVISAIAATPNGSGASITWTTNEAASTKVIYSVDSSYGTASSETDTSPRVTSHTKALTGLLACTIYNYKVVSLDAASNTATSSAQTFLTTGCAASETPSSSTTNPVATNSNNTTTLTDTSRTLSVTTPTNFTNAAGTVVIQIKGLSSSNVLGSINKPSSSLSSAAGIVFDVKALVDNTTLVDSFDLPVTVSYTYTNSDIAGLNESSLTMYHYKNNSWLSLNSCSVDTALDKITCSAPSFSIFAIFGTPIAQASASGGTIFAAEAYYKPVVPIGGFTISAQKQSENNYLITSNAGLDVKYIALSTEPEFKTAVLTPYAQSLIWNSCPSGANCPTGNFTIYAKFYTQWGRVSDVYTTQVGVATPVSKAPIKVEQPTTCPYFVKYARKGDSNSEILKIKQFLNSHQNAGLVLTQKFDNALVEAIKKFQSTYAEKILTPWGFTKPTGLWYKSTIKTANDIQGCATSVTLDNGKVLK